MAGFVWKVSFVKWNIIKFEVIFRPRYPRPSVRAIRKYYHPSVRAIENIAVRASALFKILPSERPLFSKYYHPSVQNHKILTSSALSQLSYEWQLGSRLCSHLYWPTSVPTLSEADEVVIIALNPGELKTVHIITYLISPQGVGNTLVKNNISWLRKCRAHWLERHPPAPPPTLRSRNYSIHPILTSRLQQLSSTFSVFNLSPGSGPKPGAYQSCPSWISSNLQGQISSRIYHLDVWYKLIIKSKFMSVSSVTNQRTDSIFISKKQYICLIEILSQVSNSVKL